MRRLGQGKPSLSPWRSTKAAMNAVYGKGSATAIDPAGKRSSTMVVVLLTCGLRHFIPHRWRKCCIARVQWYLVFPGDNSARKGPSPEGWNLIVVVVYQSFLEHLLLDSRQQCIYTRILFFCSGLNTSAAGQYTFTEIIGMQLKIAFPRRIFYSVVVDVSKKASPIRATSAGGKRINHTSRTSLGVDGAMPRDRRRIQQLPATLLECNLSKGEDPTLSTSNRYRTNPVRPEIWRLKVVKQQRLVFSTRRLKFDYNTIFRSI